MTSLGISGLALAAVVREKAPIRESGGLAPLALSFPYPVQGTPTIPFGRAGPPAWTFFVHHFVDPYAGKVQPEVGENVRAVAAEVEIVNDDDQPLTVTLGSLRLRDEEGYEYLPGSIVGAEPRLNGRSLPAGDWARGWVWYAVPTAARLTELVFVAPQSELEVELPRPVEECPSPAVRGRGCAQSPAQSPRR